MISFQNIISERLPVKHHILKEKYNRIKNLKEQLDYYDDLIAKRDLNIYLLKKEANKKQLSHTAKKLNEKYDICFIVKQLTSKTIQAIQKQDNHKGKILLILNGFSLQADMQKTLPRIDIFYYPELQEKELIKSEVEKYSKIKKYIFY